MKSKVSLPVSSILILVFLIVFSFCNLSQARVITSKAEAVATLTTMMGKVEAKDYQTEIWKLAGLGMILFPGDQLKTDENSRAQIVFLDGTLVRVNGQSLLEIKMMKKTAQGKVSEIDLPKGEVWAQTTKKGSQFQITTPSAVAAVKGTELDLTVTETGETILIVIQGLVELTNELGSILASEMTKSIATKTQAPVSQPITPGQIPGWSKKIQASFKLVLSSKVSGEKNVNEPFDVVIKALNDQDNQLDSNNASLVTISSTSKKTIFSTDGGSSWVGSVNCQLINGQGSVKAKLTGEGEEEITAVAPDCLSAKLQVKALEAKQKSLIIQFKDEDKQQELEMQFEKQ